MPTGEITWPDAYSGHGKPRISMRIGEFIDETALAKEILLLRVISDNFRLHAVLALLELS
jgi:hypothetical protein